MGYKEMSNEKSGATCLKKLATIYTAKKILVADSSEESRCFSQPQTNLKLHPAPS